MQTILNQSAWWLKSLKETLESLDVKTSGLDSEEVEKRRKQFGANQFVDHKEKPIWKQLLVRFRNPLILLLLFASVISAFMGEISNFIIISILVLFSVLLDFIQEHKAGKAADSLRHSVSVQATVVRDGNIINIPVSQVVPGDLVLLSAGDLVPADGRVLETNDFFVLNNLCSQERPILSKNIQENSKNFLTILQMHPMQFLWEPQSSVVVRKFSL